MHLETAGQKAIFSGDLMHHPIQVPEAQLSTIFCWDRDQSHKTRAAFLDRHADSGTLILPAHFPGRTAGRIVRQGDGLMFDFSEE